MPIPVAVIASTLIQVISEARQIADALQRANAGEEITAEEWADMRADLNQAISDWDAE